jgi:hypothetical protein
MNIFAGKDAACQEKSYYFPLPALDPLGDIDIINKGRLR